MRDYDIQLAAAVEAAERHERLPYVEEHRCRKCGRVNARVVSVDGHRLYVTYVPERQEAEAVCQSVRLHRFARLSGGRAPRNAPHRVRLYYALLDHPDCPDELPAWCSHGREIQLER